MDEPARKAVLRLFTYGLHVITSRDGDLQDAFTANWLTQVSFEPPLVALSVENKAFSLPLIRGSGVFAICVLESGRRDLAASLGRSLHRGTEKLDGIAWHATTGSADAAGAAAPPIIEDCLGYLRCAVLSETPAGDSTLFVARIYGAGQLREGEPLTMRETGFRHSG